MHPLTSSIIVTCGEVSSSATVHQIDGFQLQVDSWETPQNTPFTIKEIALLHSSSASGPGHYH